MQTMKKSENEVGQLRASGTEELLRNLACCSRTRGSSSRGPCGAAIPGNSIVRIVDWPSHTVATSRKYRRALGYLR